MFPSHRIVFGVYVASSKQILLIDLILSILVKQAIIIILISHKEKFEDQKLNYCSKLIIYMASLIQIHRTSFYDVIMMSFFLQGKKAVVLKEIMVATAWKTQHKTILGL